ncbi:MAG: radical SAM protein [Elusimicrobia bacterium]|nr:radical SAM protein [Elusimicrobiota bacterium]
MASSLLVSLRTSVGCYWNKCAFCSLSLRKYQQRNIDHVLDEFAEVVHRYKPATILLSDLSVSAHRLLQIAEGIIRKRIRVKWEAFARLDTNYTPSLCRILSRSGCTALRFGLESGNQRVENLMNKGHDLKEVPSVLENLHRAGIYTSVTAIMGFPTETVGELMDTVNFLKANSRNLSNIGLSSFGLNAGSDVFNNPAKYSVNNIQQQEDMFFSRNFDYDVACGISHDQARDYIKQFRLKKWDRVQEKLNRHIGKILTECKRD